MIRTETDLQRCRELWEAFSPHQDAWDDWELIHAFHDPDKHRFNFLVREDTNGKPDGLVTLVHDTSQNRHTLMGGAYPDGRSLWIKPDHFPEVFEQFPDRTVLFDLEQGWVAELLSQHPQFAANFAEQDMRYFVVPAAIEFDFDHHLDRFTTEKRQKFNYDLRNIRKKNPVLHWSDDNEAELFIDLINQAFGPESDYADEANANELRRVIAHLKQAGRLRTLVIEVEGRREAVSMSILHSNKMIALYSSANKKVNNLGKLLNVETIQEACRLRVDEISFMTGMKWKADWKMNSEPCITMRKPVGPWPDTSTGQ